MKRSILICLISIGAIVGLSGCGPSPDEVPAINQSRLSVPGDVVGKLPDGREVRRWKVWNDGGDYIHYIYVVADATTVSENHVEQRGKVVVPVTDVVIINGKKYIPEKN